VLLARNQPAASAPVNNIRSVTTTPGLLSSGSPFLLTVTLTGKASVVRGEWNHEQISFWKSPRPVEGSEVWYALAGVDVDVEPGKYLCVIHATMADGATAVSELPIPVAAAHYRITTLSVPQNFVQPDATTQKDIAADRQLKDRVFAHSAPDPEWSGNFVRPVNAPPTDSFGTRRVFKGVGGGSKLDSVHRGMDFRAASGTPVLASNAGTVILARKLFYEGNLVVIDHGQGLSTLYMHLSRIEIAEGQHVGKGQRLGLSGATGRVTGPHLHFAVRWQGGYLDPAGLFRLALAGKP
jgi:murein DD-endopeptidase MepM/ murein hydrolase activator NlpD